MSDGVTALADSHESGGPGSDNDPKTGVIRNCVDLSRGVVPFVTGLALASEQRANHAQAFAMTHGAAREKITSTFKRKRDRIERESSEARAEANGILEEQLRAIDARVDQTIADLQSRTEQKRTNYGERYGEREATARRELKEAIWLADTVFEANEHEPATQRATLLRGLESRRRALAETGTTAAAWLGRSRFKSEALLNIAVPAEIDPEDLDVDETPRDDGLEAINARLTAAESRLADAEHHATANWRRISGLFVPRLFRNVVPLCVLIATAAIGFGVGVVLADMAIDTRAWTGAGIGAVAGIALLGLLWWYASRRTDALATRVAQSQQEGFRALSEIRTLAIVRAAEQSDELLATRDRDIKAAKRTYEPIIEKIATHRDAKISDLDERVPAEVDKLEVKRTTLREEAQNRHATRVSETTERERARLDAAQEKVNAALAEADAAAESERSRILGDWKLHTTESQTFLNLTDAFRNEYFPSWKDPSAWKDFVPPHTAGPAIGISTVRIDRSLLPGGLPGGRSDNRANDASASGGLNFDDPLPPVIDLPITLGLPEQCSMLIRCRHSARDEALELMRSTILRILVTLPPGKARFTIIDPVGLGQSFAGFMHLADHDDALVSGRIWTEPRHIEQQLLDLTEHMEKVIQAYLRNAFETIADYNAAAGEIAEPYRFLVMADFPANVSDESAKRLESIIQSGARCGVFPLILWNTDQPLPSGIDPNTLESCAIRFREIDGELRVDHPDLEAWPRINDDIADEEAATELVHAVGAASIDASRVAVPFDVVTPDAKGLWSKNSDRKLEVPLGKCGATRLQDLVIGPGTSQHGLVAGKTGSGKSTLLHVLITNLALWYSPEEVNFYLVDFKKGVEFKTYARHDLPHAVAVAVESDREFGLSVLERIDEELRHRGERFRDEAVQDLAGFRRQCPDEPMPRVLLIIDEFQELFVEDDRIGQEASLLMDRIVRQGRAFGVHVLLGSQTLGGAYSLPRSTLGQMQVRIALQCSETDAYLIMSDDNSAARLLARPGEAIYNDAGGRIEGNSPFQVVWLPDEVRDEALSRVRAAADAAEADGRRTWRSHPLIVFEGGAPAQIADNHLLAGAIDAPPSESPSVDPPRAWLGEAIAIKDPTNAIFRRQSGANLVMVGQRDDAANAMMTIAALSLAATAKATDKDSGDTDDATFVLLDGSPPDAPHAGALESTLSGLGRGLRSVAYRDVDDELVRLHAIMRDRDERDATNEPSIFLLMFGMQRFRSIRPNDDYSFSMDEDAKPKADRLFLDIVTDGPRVGIHVIMWCDTMANLSRSLPRQGLREFDLRVAFQMSAADSTQFIDGAGASNLGLARAMLYSEESGSLEKFRPYDVPDPAWLASVRDRLTSERR